MKRKETIFFFFNEDSLKGLWGNITHTNIHIIRVPEEEEQEKGVENIFEDIIAENSPNWGRGSDPGCISSFMPRHVVIKMAKTDKKRILKASKKI